MFNRFCTDTGDVAQTNENFSVCAHRWWNLSSSLKNTQTLAQHCTDIGWSLVFAGDALPTWSLHMLYVACSSKLINIYYDENRNILSVKFSTSFIIGNKI